MDMIIGDAPKVGAAGQYRPDLELSMLEARLLDIRKPRRQRGGPPVGQTERREGGGPAADSPSGQVLTLLIPEGHKVPRGVESGNYRIFLRFVQRGSGRI